MTKNKTRNTIWVLHTLLGDTGHSVLTGHSFQNADHGESIQIHSLKSTPWVRKLNSGFRKDKTAGRTLQAKPARTEWFMREPSALWDGLELRFPRNRSIQTLQSLLTPAVSYRKGQKEWHPEGMQGPSLYKGRIVCSYCFQLIALEERKSEFLPDR